ncbi:MAG: DUF4956 domain-containing protein [Planctomycetota bacterium]
MKQLRDWLGAGGVADTASIPEIAARLALASALGGIVALVYTLSRRPRQRMDGLAQTLLLLCPLIAMVTMAVGQNVAAAFTLVGTLAIVRFRTAVRDTRDTVFVIFSVAAGLAIGALNPEVALTGTVLVGALALLSRLAPRREPRHPDCELVVTITPPDPDLSELRRLVGDLCPRLRVARSELDRRSQRLTVTFVLPEFDPGLGPAVLDRLLPHPEIVGATLAPRR